VTETQCLERQAYHLIQDLRLLARRDSGIDPQLESFRLQFVEAFERFQDIGDQSGLTPFIVDGERILTSNKELVLWLKRELERLS
jgi:hypothetical protein